MTPKQREKLDIETDEEREQRIGVLLNSISSSSTAPQPTDQEGTIKWFRTHDVPESNALERAKAFLPVLKAANVDLLAQAKQDPRRYDLEDVSQDTEVVEMDVGLGLFDIHGQPTGDLGPEIHQSAKRKRRDSDSGDDSSDLSDDSNNESQEAESSASSTDDQENATKTSTNSRSGSSSDEESADGSSPSH